jgi:hypothetical protein
MRIYINTTAISNRSLRGEAEAIWFMNIYKRLWKDLRKKFTEGMNPRWKDLYDELRDCHARRRRTRNDM